MRILAIYTAILGLALVFHATYAQTMNRPFSIEDALSVKGFTARVPIHLSPDGRSLAYSVQSHFRHLGEVGDDRRLPTGVLPELANSEVWVTDLQSGNSLNLTPGWGSSWAPRWSPDGRYLVFYSDRNGIVQLWLWEHGTKESRLLCKDPVWPFFGFEVPKWTPDGNRMICKLKQEKETREQTKPSEPNKQKALSTEGEVTVQVWEFKPKKVVEEKPKESSIPTVWLPKWADYYLADIAAVDVGTGEVRRLVRGFRPSGIEVSPDGSVIAVMNLAGVETQATQQKLFDLYLISLEGRPPRRLVQHIRQKYGISLNWSPDGQQIAFTTWGQRASGNVYVVPKKGNTSRNLTKDVEAHLGHPYEPPLWSGNGKYLYCVEGTNLWQVSVKEGRARNLTGGLNRNVVGIVCRSEGHTVWSPDGGRSIYARTVDPQSKGHGFYRIDSMNREAMPLIEENRYYGGRARFRTDVAPDNGTIVYIAQDAQHPADIWVSDLLFQKPHRVTSLNPQIEDCAFGTTRLISYWTLEGTGLHGALLLPANYKPGQRYPLIVRAYGGLSLSNYINRFGLEGSTVNNMQLLASQGYSVLLPDMPLEKGNPLKQLPDIVLPGVDKLIELGIADPDRLGLIGHSYGGYCVNCLITQTTRFRAAISSAGVSDLISNYLSPDKYGENVRMGWTESGQGRMGGSLWEFRDRYIENSPVFYLDQVETPLLLVQGGLDTVPVAQSEEMFSGLRRLGREVVLARYHGEGHGPGAWRYANVVDFWRRVLKWFDEYLKPTG
ncbi:MAG: S9 family peptidase [Candidatus Latescibacteria bacterium]|nr:S9 family peptidase [Candidatus Latescibacterota bacterium]